MIRVVETGDFGLDVLLSGGWRLVRRHGERESAVVLLRGGPGAGKSLWGLEAARVLAGALGGDVLVACVEILPTEFVAQARAARPDLAATAVGYLPDAVPSGPGPRFAACLLDNLEDTAPPDLVDVLESALDRARLVGIQPAAILLDSLIEGYGIGASLARPEMDALCKFAAAQGLALVVLEEAAAEGASGWAFAADTVLELANDPGERGRTVFVRKHRFGASAAGSHGFELRTGVGPWVIPVLPAWSWGMGRLEGNVEGVWAAGPGSELAHRDGEPLTKGDYGPLRGRHLVIQADLLSVAVQVSQVVVLRRLDLLERHCFLDVRAGGGAHASSVTSVNPSHWDVRVSTFSSPVAWLRLMVETLVQIRGSTPRSASAVTVRLLDFEHAMLSGRSEAWRGAIRVLTSLSELLYGSALLIHCTTVERDAWPAGNFGGPALDGDLLIVVTHAESGAGTTAGQAPRVVGAKTLQRHGSWFDIRL